MLTTMGCSDYDVTTPDNRQIDICANGMKQAMSPRQQLFKHLECWRHWHERSGFKNSKSQQIIRRWPVIIHVQSPQSVDGARVL